MKIAALQHHAVRRHEIAGAKHHDVAGNHLFDGNRDDCAVASCVGVDSDRSLQCFGGKAGAVLLSNIQGD